MRYTDIDEAAKEAKRRDELAEMRAVVEGAAELRVVFPTEKQIDLPFDGSTRMSGSPKALFDAAQKAVLDYLDFHLDLHDDNLSKLGIEPPARKSNT